MYWRSNGSQLYWTVTDSTDCFYANKLEDSGSFQPEPISLLVFHLEAKVRNPNSNHVRILLEDSPNSHSVPLETPGVITVGSESVLAVTSISVGGSASTWDRVWRLIHQLVSLGEIYCVGNTELTIAVFAGCGKMWRLSPWILPRLSIRAEMHVTGLSVFFLR